MRCWHIWTAGRFVLCVVAVVFVLVYGGQVGVSIYGDSG